ncbi:MAG: hypothetical protein DRH15_10510 [Deltaproteobacteria bacterium]|nr:MAG: hypothetical protein DRH15_10510 [Deltaproteobacteria bacterium]
MKDIIETVPELALKKNLSPEVVKTCLERAIEGAVCEFFDIRDCDADVEDGVVIAHHHVGEDMGIGEGQWFYAWAFYGDVISVEYTFACFEGIAPVLERTEELFYRMLDDVAADELLKKWRKKVHEAVEGVIIAKGPEQIEIDLGDGVKGIMPRRRWVKREVSSYRHGKLMYFYVLKANRTGNDVVVELSRNSIGLPATLVEQFAPWTKVKPVRRIAGRKSWVTSDSPVTSTLLREVGKLLNGEVVEVVSGGIRRDGNP